MGVDGVSGNNPLADLIDHSRIKPQSPLLQAVRMIIIWLVVSTPLKNISQLMSAGITIPNIWKIRYAPNHQPVIILMYILIVTIQYAVCCPDMNIEDVLLSNI